MAEIDGSEGCANDNEPTLVEPEQSHRERERESQRESEGRRGVAKTCLQAKSDHRPRKPCLSLSLEDDECSVKGHRTRAKRGNA
jgi:hypothetical protein